MPADLESASVAVGSTPDAAGAPLQPGQRFAQAFLRPFVLDGRVRGKFYSLRAMQAAGFPYIARLPYALRIVLESALRNCDGSRITPGEVKRIASWTGQDPGTGQFPFAVARILAPDSSGAPLLADLAAMRDVAAEQGCDPAAIEPIIPVDVIVDHSVTVDYFARSDALSLNMAKELERNAERFAFLKWAGRAFRSVEVIPPGVGILHQVNLEYLASIVVDRDGLLFPDTLMGADSHTPMIGGIGVLGWGIGGIEVTAAMLGQPIYFRAPQVIGVELSGRLGPGVTATDAVLSVTEFLRKADVVGKFVEFIGEGVASLSVPDRATIANMAPEYGAMAAFFATDEITLDYFRMTRAGADCDLIRAYLTEQGLFGTPSRASCDYSTVLGFSLSDVRPSVAGPKRPEDKIELDGLKRQFVDLLAAPQAEGGYGLAIGSTAIPGGGLQHGEVALAAITSCTNTSNPRVMVAAGLLARKAVERGLRPKAGIKTSFGPGSMAVTDYLERAGLQRYLDALGFQVVGYGCTTCIGNSGPLAAEVEAGIAASGVVAAAVLSGNRNFEARIHPSLKANFLMSPPLVIAFAIAGRVTIDMASEPLGFGADGVPVFLKDIWPSEAEIDTAVRHAYDPRIYTARYARTAFADEHWRDLAAPAGARYPWDPESTYFRLPPYFDGFSLAVEPPRPIENARALAIFGNSITTDHISPGGAIDKDGPAGRYLQDVGVPPRLFNAYLSRRTNHEVMMRGTFGNVRLRNLMAAGREGPFTTYWPGGEAMSIFDAAMRYSAAGVPTLVFAGKAYGNGSSRDWAAKGPSLLGVRAVVAESFERIHRSNLVSMGILPCVLAAGGLGALSLDGSETFALAGLEDPIEPMQQADLIVTRRDGSSLSAKLTVRVDTEIEAQYYRHGGIMPYVLRGLLAGGGNA